MKRNIFLALTLALVAALVLTGCPQPESTEPVGAENTKLQAPASVKLNFGTVNESSHVLISFNGVPANYKYEVGYKIWVKQTDKNTLYELVPAAPLSPDPSKKVLTGWVPEKGTWSALNAVGQATFTAGTSDARTRVITLGSSTPITITDFNGILAQAPFIRADKIKIGVQTVMDAPVSGSGYDQQHIRIDPSPIVWASKTYEWK